MMGPMTSVVLCTHNRAGSLRQTLPTIIGQQLEGTDWELLVVDNASPDDTRAVVEAVAGDAINVRYVFEPEIGLSAARNRGITEAKGDLVVFVDDDVLAPPDWLANVVAGFAAFPTAAAVCGRVVLALPGPRPEWLPVELEGFLAAFDQGEAAHLLPPDVTPVGANMAFRRDWIDGEDGFRTDLGRRGSSLAASEEEEFLDRLRARGGRIAYLPDAPVRHVIGADRLTRRWFVRRSFAQGRSRAVLVHGRGVGRVELLARAAAGAVRAVVGRHSLLRHLRPSRAERFAGLAGSVAALGYSLECLRIAVRPRSRPSE